jgi:UDP-3-O-[3-hydroxymyristoyl] glucosamine N-acyltransferase
MEFTAKIIAQFLNGAIEGNPDVSVNNVSGIEKGKEGTIAFLANPKYAKYLYTTKASIVLINKDFNVEKKVNCTLIRVEDAYQSLASLLELYEQQKPVKNGIHEMAVIEKSATIGKDVYIGPFAYIGEKAVVKNNAKIYPHVYIGDQTTVGNGTVIYPGVKIYHDCRIGAGCIIHAGTIIGSDGFGFAPKSSKDYKKIPQVGNVILEDDVEIGANCSIDRATMGSTIIKKGVKLDNLIQIAHNVEIGKNTVMAAQTGISGSTKLGSECMLGGQVGLIGHISIADGVKIGAQSGLTSTIKETGKIVIGSPAFGFTDHQKSYVYFRKLPALKAEIDALRKEMDELKNLNHF